MLPPKHQLNKKKDFERVFKQGKFFQEKLLFLKVRENKLKTSRMGFIIGKKKIKKAVERNKIKRKLREAVRFYLNKIKPGYDMIFWIKPEISGKELIELKEIMIKILKKAKLTNDQ